MIKLRLVCGNCGKIVTFEGDNASAAFEAASHAGWDTVERFGYTACDHCPGVSVYLPMLHAQEARSAATPEEREALLRTAAEYTTHDWPVFGDGGTFTEETVKHPDIEEMLDQKLNGGGS